MMRQNQPYTSNIAELHQSIEAHLAEVEGVNANMVDTSHIPRTRTPMTTEERDECFKRLYELGVPPLPDSVRCLPDVIWDNE